MGKDKNSGGYVDLKLNGITLGEGIKEFINFYLAGLSPDEKGANEPKDHPIIARQRKIADNAHGIEDVVKKILDDSVRADKPRADKIIKSLAYEIAKTEGFKGELEAFTDEQSRTYLSQASGALGNPTIGNKTEFTKSIFNMAAAKPGDPLYDANSALGQLIQYIATQKDSGSRRANYLQALFQEHATQPAYVTAMHDSLGQAVGKTFNPTASVADMLGEVTRRGQLQSQEYAANVAPKTYTTANNSTGAKH